MENEWLLAGEIAERRGLAKDNPYTIQVSSKPIPDNGFARFSKFENAVVDVRLLGGSRVGVVTAIDEKVRE